RQCSNPLDEIAATHDNLAREATGTKPERLLLRPHDGDDASAERFGNPDCSIAEPAGRAPDGDDLARGEPALCDESVPGGDVRDRHSAPLGRSVGAQWNDRVGADADLLGVAAVVGVSEDLE